MPSTPLCRSSPSFEMSQGGERVCVSCDTRLLSPSQLVCAPSETQVLFLFPYVSPVGPVATLSNGLPLGCVLRSLEGEVQEQEENSPAPQSGGNHPADPTYQCLPCPSRGDTRVWESQQHLFTCCSRGSSDSTPRQGIFLFFVVFGRCYFWNWSKQFSFVQALSVNRLHSWKCHSPR